MAGRLKTKSGVIWVCWLKGATSWEFQIGPLYGWWPFPRFMRTGSRPGLGWDSDWRKDQLED